MISLLAGLSPSVSCNLLTCSLLFCFRNGQPSTEPTLRREGAVKHETSTNGRLGSPPHLSQQVSFRVRSPKSPEYDEYDEDHQDEQLDRRYFLHVF